MATVGYGSSQYGSSLYGATATTNNPVSSRWTSSSNLDGSLFIRASVASTCNWASAAKGVYNRGGTISSSGTWVSHSTGAESFLAVIGSNWASSSNINGNTRPSNGTVVSAWKTSGSYNGSHTFSSPFVSAWNSSSRISGGRLWNPVYTNIPDIWTVITPTVVGP